MQNGDLKQLISVLIDKRILKISTLPNPINFYYYPMSFSADLTLHMPYAINAIASIVFFNS